LDLVKRVKVDDASPEVKNFIKQLDVEKGEYVLEMAGKPVAAVISPWLMEKYAKGREEILSLLRQSWERNRGVEEAAVEREVAEVIQEVRREKRSGREGRPGR
jgi:hypothetical protein